MALWFLAAAAIGTFSHAAEASVGGVLWTVNIPPGAVGTVGAQCTGGSSGSAVAVVPGGKLNFPKFQTLLVTSCVEAGQAKLFFLDPSTNPATLVKTINTSVTPTNGWESLAVRPDKVDLIGCGVVSGSPKVYSIDFSSIPPNNTADGAATLIFTGPAGSTCQGLAWDVTSNPKTIYQSASTSPSIRHLSETGASVSEDVASGCPGTTTGMAVGVVNSATVPFAGSVLFVACPQGIESTPEIRQIKRADGSLVTSVEIPTGSLDLTGITSQPGDLECDPVTFGLSQSWHPGIRNKDVLWVKVRMPPTRTRRTPWVAVRRVRAVPPRRRRSRTRPEHRHRWRRAAGLLGGRKMVGRWPPRDCPRRGLYTRAVTSQSTSKSQFGSLCAWTRTRTTCSNRPSAMRRPLKRTPSSRSTTC
jgi:hypothetical protein